LFANRFTALVDACTLTNTLKRNLLLTLAEAGFATLNMEAKSAAEFIADTIALDEGRAVAAIRQMRGQRIRRTDRWLRQVLNSP
jgi:hypothetical protein